MAISVRAIFHVSRSKICFKTHIIHMFYIIMATKTFLECIKHGDTEKLIILPVRQGLSIKCIYSYILHSKILCII